MSALGMTLSVLRTGTQLVRRAPQHNLIRKCCVWVYKRDICVKAALVFKLILT
ncbi:hypothetical protein Baya_15915 [Bagarius yarrelli]|uniref:Uncharacterized protein n=1 Tax=Bagarius yarrelli TaxID=175774 RepID=A0A556VM01_BAGYA|nr:hypothetical protein Baya_15915 [Bagarius yarrelli]